MKTLQVEKAYVGKKFGDNDRGEDNGVIRGPRLSVQ